MEQTQKLSEYLKEANSPLLFNTRKSAEKIYVGRWKLATEAKESIAIHPLLCSIGDHYLLFLTVTQAAQGTVMASTHTAIKSENSLIKDLQQNNNAVFTADQSSQLWQTLWAQLQNAWEKKAPSSADALQIALSLKKQQTRKDQGSSYCLNHLLAEKLSQEGYKVFLPMGQEPLEMIKRIIRHNETVKRSSRKLILTWQLDRQKQTQALSLPQSWQVSITPADGVLGKDIPQKITEQLELKIDKDKKQVAINLPQKLNALLTQEKAALSLNDKPQIAHIYGAWVYLDKGRGWGLEMNDRLVGKSGVAGHVIGFYGSHFNFRSPRGYPIHEGAIVYIRKGQEQLKKGIELDFDPTRYPTPWPPQSR